MNALAIAPSARDQDRGVPTLRHRAGAGQTRASFSQVIDALPDENSHVLEELIDW